MAPIVHEMRKTKSEAEAALIKKAIDATADAQREVIRLIRPGLPEYKLEGAIVGAFLAGGASRAGFPSIVGSGPNSTVLHYDKNDRTIEDGDLVVSISAASTRGTRPTSPGLTPPTAASPRASGPFINWSSTPSPPPLPISSRASARLRA